MNGAGYVVFSGAEFAKTGIGLEKETDILCDNYN